ncbi:30S ribosomal protein S17e [Candidatus Woesearchaeota archaeon]|nr:30S ribosomal protein S17e [Candidatus Woesearchaeota archaeon]
MGRIKTAKIKSVTKELFKEYGEKFTKNFDDNKALVSEYASGASKKLRNIIAGYITRLVRTKKEY